MRGSFKNGKLHGLIQIFGKMSVDPKGHCSEKHFEGLSFLGWFEEGKPTGKVIMCKSCSEVSLVEQDTLQYFLKEFNFFYP